MATPIPRILSLTPSGLGAPAPVVAAGRAGGLGVLDFAADFQASAAIAAARAVARFGDRPFGLRLPAEELNGSLLRGLPETLTTLIVAEPDDGRWSGPLGVVRTLGRSALAEVTSRRAAQSAARAGADGLILAGHEAGGHGSDDSTFILLQAVLALGPTLPPIWVRGGIGPQSAAASIAAGASGVVLDGALLLARESPLPEPIRDRLGRFDGGETLVLGAAIGRPRRLHAPPAAPVLARLRAAAEQGGDAWQDACRSLIGWGPDQAWPVGQDAALAAPLARKYVTVGGIIQAVNRALDESPRLARDLRPLAENSPLAQAHATRYPIVQGPMTRVSDSVAFAQAVAEGGALPFLALALMRGDDIRPLLADASRRLRGKAWGVGILGFVPPELRAEQVAAIREVRPPFALIAGGRPDQARSLDEIGVATYLHVPSPGLLRQFLKDGARRFVLEGRECGGHVGPRSSFMLWEQAVAVVTEAIEGGIPAGEIHLLFAGGLHDGRSTAAVATLAAPLAALGVKLGILVGTAYLFTAEAVATGAIVPGFQDAAVTCDRTVLLETGPGHEVRVSPTPFARQFEAERRRLLAEGRTAEEVREALERLNTGRLRVAAKGVERRDGAGSPLAPVPPDDQHSRGVYMLGQVATLRDRVTTIAELHRDLADGSVAWLDRAAVEAPEPPDRARPADIAIVGLAAIMPGAADCRTFWENTLRGVDAITEVPPDRWDWRLYYDADPKAPDKISSKWGGFVPDVPFEPLRYGMPPSSLPSIEPLQMLVLETVRAALDDAGYRDRPFPRDRTAVVLGAGGGAAQLAMGYAFRSYLPMLETALPGVGREALERCAPLLPEWTEDSFPGILLNVAAGRVANRFNLGGANYTVDAACGSSLAAAALAVRELESGAADVVILGGADTVQNPFTYLAFSKTHAFSPRGRCRPFDASADGIVISEGVAAVVLKRLADAERDGDRIYAVIKGMGASSDGRAKGLTAPRPEGQVSALTRAYERSGVSPATVGYVEAHGTGTAAGDLAEVAALSAVFAEAGAARGSCALGSVKSLIGHTKCAAGLAGLINAALALYHRVLPPTIGVEVPNPRAAIDGSPFHISAATRPWLHDARLGPRRAGVSAFGFGGTNFHAVLEAFDRDPLPRPSPLQEWPAELLVWSAEDRGRLLSELARLNAALDAGARPRLRDLVAWRIDEESRRGTATAGCKLAIVAFTLDDLRKKLDWVRKALGEPHPSISGPDGVEYREGPPAPGRLAFLFPGQGSQYPEMLGDLAVAWPVVREAIEGFDEALRSRGKEAVGPRIFGAPAFDESGRAARRAALRPAEVAQPAVGSASVALFRLLGAFGVEPEMLAGHSYGELVALHAAGSLTLADLAELSEARGRLIVGAVGAEPGSMAALATGPGRIEEVLAGIEGVAAVNWNGPAQTVISGSRAGVTRAVERAKGLGIGARELAVACAFHSPLVAGARDPLAALVARLRPMAPRRPVYSNVTAQPYPVGPERIAQQVGDHVARPVRFAEMIEAMYADGARTFVEVGPGSTLTGLVDSILGDRPHQAIACDRPGRPGVATWLLALGKLVVAGAPVRLERLMDGRQARRLDPKTFAPEADPDAPSASAWLVNGSRARPIAGPEPARLGVSGVVAPPASVRRESMPLSPGRNGTPKPPPIDPPPASAGSATVIEAFQETMRTFLDVQRATMLEYLAGRSAGASTSGTSARPPGVTAHRNGNGTHGGNGKAPGHPGHQPSNISNLKFQISNLKSDIPESESNRAEPSAVPESSGPEPLAERLLRIVRDRTGYPAEMLRLDLDLEADLGIDSIKRVEILGSLRDAAPELALGSDSEAMDALSRARTLGAIVERLVKAGPGRSATAVLERPEPGNGPHPGPLPGGEGERGVVAGVRRLVSEVVEATLPEGRAGLRPGGLVLVTDDGRGIARALAADLKALGHPVVRVRHGVAEGEVEGVNLTSEVAVAALLERVRARGPLAGIVHPLPLRERPAAGLDAEAWAGRLGPEVRGLFLLARAAADDLEDAASRGGACLIAATGMGGAFAGSGRAPGDFFPGHGGVAGLVKTLAREWPAVRARVVDLDPRGEPEVLAADLVHEVFADDQRAEVGYQLGRRIGLKAVATPLPETSRADFEVQPGEPILITGGARGITAAVAADLARRWRPTLLLVGSSPIPPELEDAETAGRQTPADLKTALFERLRRSRGEVGPAEVERAYQALRREREIRANLEALRATGATVEYARADVRDAEALGLVLGDWRRRFGPIAGLIHGAGVIQDKLLRDKTPESFDRVLGTKVEGALTLARLLDAEPPRFAAFFSSVAGRFGNRGQADYAAANEALNKLAVWLDRRWPGRVVSMIWGPWSGLGMVSDLEGHLGRRGLGMIPPDVGRARLADELLRGRKGDVEVIVAGDLGPLEDRG